MANRKYVEFKDLCINIYVRQGLSEERVLLFQDLYTSSASGTVPPILVSEANVLIDGRHRVAALKGLGEKGAVCEVVKATDDFEITMAAMKANVGGSKELTMTDIRMSIIRLIEAKYSLKKITQALPFPKELSRKLVKAATQIWHQQRTRMATALVMGGEMTPEEAAKRFRLTPALIVKAVAKRNRDEDDGLSNVGSAKGTVTQRYYAMTKRMGKFFKVLTAKYEQGEYTEGQIQEILGHVLHQARQHQHAMADWEERFKVILKTSRPLETRIPPKKLEVGKPASL